MRLDDVVPESSSGTRPTPEVPNGADARGGAAQFPGPLALLKLQGLSNPVAAGECTIFGVPKVRPNLFSS